MEATRASFRALLEECKGELGEKRCLELFTDHVREDVVLLSANKLCNRSPGLLYGRSWWVYAGVVLVISLVVTPVFMPGVAEDLYYMVRESECIVENNMMISEMSRPVFDCNICRNVTHVPVVYGISKTDFIEKYAYTDIPVLIKQGTVNWTAMETFSLKYFKKIYSEADGKLQEKKEKEEKEKGPAGKKLREEEEMMYGEEEGGDGLSCQFFPYKTEFNSLIEALNMKEDRAAYKKGQKPWYFGWSNCNDEVQEELRRHYNRPYFLPDDSETSALDWIFMGGRGRGAPMHLDSVSRPSWQAQISGRKTWSLDPPPECLAECTSMNITVEQGDIFVINTNVWYHGTFVHPGAVSICIGSEYD